MIRQEGFFVCAMDAEGRGTLLPFSRNLNRGLFAHNCFRLLASGNGDAVSAPEAPPLRRVLSEDEPCLETRFPRTAIGTIGEARQVCDPPESGFHRKRILPLRTANLEPFK